jgi:hypothetical protein
MHACASSAPRTGCSRDPEPNSRAPMAAPAREDFDLYSDKRAALEVAI